ncbi:MAG: CRISPR-associated endonuclease Cas2 [bacterium]
MRLIIFFDLPVKTKKQRRIYSKFRKYLIKTGHQMLQYSVYAKILNNRDAAINHTKNIEANAPKEGNIRVMILTEKQYTNMKIITGKKSFQEKQVKVNPFIHF